MSGVWVFKNGVVRLVENQSGCDRTRKVLVHTPSGEAVCSHKALEAKLTELGWERYHEDPTMVQYHKRNTVHLISLPKDFAHVKSMHMYDIIVKNRNTFQVVDAHDQADAGKSEAVDAGEVEA